MEAVEAIQKRVEAALAGVTLTPLPHEGQAPSLVVPAEHGLAVARFLRDAPELRFDYASNVTGVDWPTVTVKETVRVPKTVDGAEQVVEETVAVKRPGYLEVVYHLYSIELKHGPLVLRLRTGNRVDQVRLPSLTPVWRSAELQEREIYDLFGVIFEGHPDLRRLLMWEGFADHPMRKDYVEPDDYEYEPTPHDEVREKAQRHWHAG